MVRIIQLAVVSLVFWSLGCEPSLPPQEKEPIDQTPPKSVISYLALGDSYTIGESVAEDQRWPV
ncbi:MAG: SGNH/GDSL hydrolase family protein, partial [Bacteroidota bacterium]